MIFQSINPYNQQVLKSFEEFDQQQINNILQKANEQFEQWRQTAFSVRSQILLNASTLLVKNIELYAQTISEEMGKPIQEARTEIKKCALVCEYYAQNAAQFLADEIIKTNASESFVSNEPLGCILAIMPWNYPFWQVFRFLAPAIMAGNVALLKHAPNVFGCALQIGEIMQQAGCPKGVFQNLIVHHDKVKSIIESNIVRAVTLTGSEKAGASVASIAGQNIKKTLLELGGSNAFVVLEDANIDKAVEIGVLSRMLNAGQSCIAAKRFIVVEKVYDEFLTKFILATKQLKIGDPFQEQTQIGPLARIDLADKLAQQIDDSVKLGAVVQVGGQQNGAFYSPTIVTEITTEMPLFLEETFGPVAPIMKVTDEDEAMQMAKKTNFGLGMSIFTNNIDKAKKLVPSIDDGAVFINALVKSDPQLPFGGTKRSGYGRELSKEGIFEFVNKKTVYIAKFN